VLKLKTKFLDVRNLKYTTKILNLENNLDSCKKQKGFKSVQKMIFGQLEMDIESFQRGTSRHVASFGQ